MSEEYKSLNEHCCKCACYGWGCPADYWRPDGTAMKWKDCEQHEVMTAYCYEQACATYDDIMNNKIECTFSKDNLDKSIQKLQYIIDSEKPIPIKN